MMPLVSSPFDTDVNHGVTDFIFKKANDLDCALVQLSVRTSGLTLAALRSSADFLKAG